MLLMSMTSSSRDEPSKVRTVSSAWASAASLGADHLAEKCFLAVEVEVERALADAGQASDIIELGPGVAALAEYVLGRFENFFRAGIRTPLPAGLTGRVGLEINQLNRP